MVDLKSKNKLIFTLIGNINRTKNYYQFSKFLKNINLPIQVNIIGEILFIDSDSSCSCRVNKISIRMNKDPAKTELN